MNRMTTEIPIVVLRIPVLGTQHNHFKVAEGAFGIHMIAIGIFLFNSLFLDKTSDCQMTSTVFTSFITTPGWFYIVSVVLTIQIYTALGADAVAAHSTFVGRIRRAIETHRHAAGITPLFHVQDRIANPAAGAAEIESALNGFKRPLAIVTF